MLKISSKRSFTTGKLHFSLIFAAFRLTLTASPTLFSASPSLFRRPQKPISLVAAPAIDRQLLPSRRAARNLPALTPQAVNGVIHKITLQHQAIAMAFLPIHINGQHQGILRLLWRSALIKLKLSAGRHSAYELEQFLSDPGRAGQLFIAWFVIGSGRQRRRSALAPVAGRPRAGVKRQTGGAQAVTGVGLVRSKGAIARPGDMRTTALYRFKHHTPADMRSRAENLTWRTLLRVYIPDDVLVAGLTQIKACNFNIADPVSICLARWRQMVTDPVTGVGQAAFRAVEQQYGPGRRIKPGIRGEGRLSAGGKALVTIEIFITACGLKIADTITVATGEICSRVGTAMGQSTDQQQTQKDSAATGC